MKTLVKQYSSLFFHKISLFSGLVKQLYAADVVFFSFVLLRHGFYVSLIVLKFSMLTRLALNLKRSACLCFSSAEIKGVCHYAMPRSNCFLKILYSVCVYGVCGLMWYVCCSMVCVVCMYVCVVYCDVCRYVFVV